MYFLPLQGEELRKLIGAPAYVECSSKTQEVHIELFLFTSSYSTINLVFIYLFLICFWSLLQNVKAVFDAAITVVLQPPKQKKKKSKAQKACSIL